jgi:hypothetical protein
MADGLAHRKMHPTITYIWGTPNEQSTCHVCGTENAIYAANTDFGYGGPIHYCGVCADHNPGYLKHLIRKEALRWLCKRGDIPDKLLLPFRKFFFVWTKHWTAEDWQTVDDYDDDDE